MIIYVQSFLNSATRIPVDVTTSTTVNELKTLVYNAEGVTTTVMAFHFNNVELLSTATMSSINATTGTFIGSSNTISSLSTKEQKQVAKLEIAQLRRKAAGDTSATYYRSFNTYDIDLLADKYVGNDPVNVANTLTVHRPWI